MEFISLKALSENHKIEILNLWNNEYPEKLNFQTLEEFDNYLLNLQEPSHLLMQDQHQKIVGWYFDFIRDNEK